MAARFPGRRDTVIITGRNADRLASTAAEIGALPVTCDATDPWQVTPMADEVGADLDVLVNMAGGNTDFTRSAGQHPGLEGVAAAWRANLDANLLSAVPTTAFQRVRRDPAWRRWLLARVRGRSAGPGPRLGLPAPLAGGSWFRGEMGPVPRLAGAAMWTFLPLPM